MLVRAHRGGSAPARPYVPVYTLHQMHEETGQIPKLPVVLCTGCGHPIPAPPGSARIQCRDCGKKMQVVGITPGGESNSTRR